MRHVAFFLTVLCLSSGATLSAQAYAAFGFRPAPVLTVPEFADMEIAHLLATLDGLVKSDPGDVLWQFARRLQTGQLSPVQEARVLAHLDAIAAGSPAAAAAVAGPRRMVSQLTVGKVAPDISGLDLEGAPFRLHEYRGRVVVLVFSAEWCALCRTQVPYEQFLLEKYRQWPFALLGVQTGSSRARARQEQQESGTPQRSWWDVLENAEAGGPIAAAWNVIGWPATYVLDANGVIRFVDVRDEDLLKAVRQLLTEQQAAAAHADTRRRR